MGLLTCVQNMYYKSYSPDENKHLDRLYFSIYNILTSSNRVENLEKKKKKDALLAQKWNKP